MPDYLLGFLVGVGLTLASCLVAIYLHSRLEGK